MTNKFVGIKHKAEDAVTEGSHRAGSGNDGVVVHGGTINVGAFAVGHGASATSHGTASPAYRAPTPSSVAHNSPVAAASPSTAKFDAFVSHATEDKGFVEPLIDALVGCGLRIWYDSSSIRVGNSLRESIDFGLVNSRFIIVVLSPSYFAKDWTRREVNAMFAREIGGIRVLLPVWHRVTAAEVGAFSPMLVDRLAVRSSDGVERIADAIIASISEAM